MRGGGREKWRRRAEVEGTEGTARRRWGGWREEKTVMCKRGKNLSSGRGSLLLVRTEKLLKEEK